MRINLVKNDMAGHAPGQQGKLLKGPEIRRRESITRRAHMGQFQMAVHRRPAMPRHMLDHGKNSGFQHFLRHHGAQTGDDHRIIGKGAIADGRNRFLKPEIKTRRAIHRDARRLQIRGNQTGGQAQRLDGEGRIAAMQITKKAEGPRLEPVGRAQALHPPAFLINENGDIGPIRHLPQLRRQRGELRRALHIAGKKDEAEGLFSGEEVSLRRRQMKPFKAEDNSAKRRRIIR